MEIQLNTIINKEMLKHAIIDEVKPAYEYDASGNRTEKIVGYTYHARFVNADYATLNVKILGERITTDATNPVNFEGLYIGTYVYNGKVKLFARAIGIAAQQQTADVNSEKTNGGKK